MIEDIKGLQNYLIKEADNFEDPTFKKRRMMTSPGCSKEKIEVLKSALPGIPKSYTKWVEAMNLNGISVGYFDASPYSYFQGDMVDCLLQANADDDHAEYSKKFSLYAIATIPDFLIYVATAASPFREGEIILIDPEIYGDQDNIEKWAHKLSRDFEQLLISIGNLNQIYREIHDDDSNCDEKMAEFFNRLKILGVGEEYYPAWRRVFI